MVVLVQLQDELLDCWIAATISLRSYIYLFTIQLRLLFALAASIGMIFLCINTHVACSVQVLEASRGVFDTKPNSRPRTKVRTTESAHNSLGGISTVPSQSERKSSMDARSQSMMGSMLRKSQTLHMTTFTQTVTVGLLLTTRTVTVPLNTNTTLSSVPSPTAPSQTTRSVVGSIYIANMTASTKDPALSTARGRTETISNFVDSEALPSTLPNNDLPGHIKTADQERSDKIVNLYFLFIILACLLSILGWFFYRRRKSGKRKEQGLRAVIALRRDIELSRFRIWKPSTPTDVEALPPYEGKLPDYSTQIDEIHKPPTARTRAIT